MKQLHTALHNKTSNVKLVVLLGSATMRTFELGPVAIELLYSAATSHILTPKSFCLAAGVEASPVVRPAIGLNTPTHPNVAQDADLRASVPVAGDRDRVGDDGGDDDDHTRYPPNFALIAVRLAYLLRDPSDMAIALSHSARLLLGFAEATGIQNKLGSGELRVPGPTTILRWKLNIDHIAMLWERSQPRHVPRVFRGIGSGASLHICVGLRSELSDQNSSAGCSPNSQSCLTPDPPDYIPRHWRGCEPAGRAQLLLHSGGLLREDRNRVQDRGGHARELAPRLHLATEILARHCDR